jgi:hypothetical protein
MRNVILPIYIIRGLASSVVLDPPASVFAFDLPPKKPSNLIKPIGTKFQRTGRKDSGVSNAPVRSESTRECAPGGLQILIDVQYS